MFCVWIGAAPRVLSAAAADQTKLRAHLARHVYLFSKMRRALPAPFLNNNSNPIRRSAVNFTDTALMHSHG